MVSLWQAGDPGDTVVACECQSSWPGHSCSALLHPGGFQRHPKFTDTPAWQGEGGMNEGNDLLKKMVVGHLLAQRCV